METVVRSVYFRCDIHHFSVEKLDQLNGAIVNHGRFSHNCNEISVGCFFKNNLQFWVLKQVGDQRTSWFSDFGELHL